MVSTLSLDIITKDLMLIPLILGFLVYITGSWKLICLPLLCFAMTTAISFALYSFVASHWMTVPPFIPVFMVFVTMAVCDSYLASLHPMIVIQ